MDGVSRNKTIKNMPYTGLTQLKWIEIMIHDFIRKMKKKKTKMRNWRVTGVISLFHVKLSNTFNQIYVR